MRMFLSSKRTTWPSCECQAGFWMSGAALCSSQQLAAKVAFWPPEEISVHLSEHLVANARNSTLFRQKERKFVVCNQNRTTAGI